MSKKTKAEKLLQIQDVMTKSICDPGLNSVQERKNIIKGSIRTIDKKKFF